MTLSPSLLPAMISIPGGSFHSAAMAPFLLGQTPVTNDQYNAHVDRYVNRPYVLLHTDPGTHETSLLSRVKNLGEAVGDLAARLTEDWFSREPLMFGVFTLLRLRKDMSPEGFDRPNQPVAGVSWFHAFEYCVSNGFFLPSDDQWEYAARGPEGHEYGTRSGKLTREEAHYAAENTVDVGSYPPNGFGLHDMTGLVSEWTASNPTQGSPYGLRGGSYRQIDSRYLRAADRLNYGPGGGDFVIGFRVAAALHGPL